jgi:hypothetical protein
MYTARSDHRQFDFPPRHNTILLTLTTLKLTHVLYDNNYKVPRYDEKNEKEECHKAEWKENQRHKKIHADCFVLISYFFKRLLF